MPIGASGSYTVNRHVNCSASEQAGAMDHLKAAGGHLGQAFKAAFNSAKNTTQQTFAKAQSALGSGAARIKNAGQALAQRLKAAAGMIKHGAQAMGKRIQTAGANATLALWDKGSQLDAAVGKKIASLGNRISNYGDKMQMDAQAQQKLATDHY